MTVFMDKNEDNFNNDFKSDFDNDFGNKDKNIIGAIDSIEPSRKAQRRMYENILKKAERRSRNVKLLVIMKSAVLPAACICLVAAAALMLRTGAGSADSLSGGIDIKDQAAPNTAYYGEGSDERYDTITANAEYFDSENGAEAANSEAYAEAVPVSVRTIPTMRTERRVLKAPPAFSTIKRTTDSRTPL